MADHGYVVPRNLSANPATPGFPYKSVIIAMILLFQDAYKIKILRGSHLVLKN